MASDKELKLIIKAIKEGKGLEEITQGLADISKKSKESNAVLGQLKGALGALLPAMGAGAIVASMKSMSDSALKYADSVDKVADITGVSAEKASEWVVQAQHTGTSAETVANAMGILSKQLITNQKSFEDFGIKVKDNNGTLLSTDEILRNVRVKTKELGDGAAATAMEMSLFGRSGKELHDFLSADSDEMDNVTQAAKRLGLILNNTQKDSLEQMNRKLKDFEMIQQSLGLQINMKLLPIIIELQKGFLNIVDSMAKLKEQGGLLGVTWDTITGNARRSVSMTGVSWDNLDKKIQKVTQSEVDRSDEVAKKIFDIEQKKQSGRAKSREDAVKRNEEYNAEELKQWETFNSNLESGFSNTITSWVDGVSTFQDAFNGLISDVLKAWRKMIADMIAQWAASNLMNMMGATFDSTGKMITAPSGLMGNILNAGSGTVSAGNVASTAGTIAGAGATAGLAGIGAGIAGTLPLLGIGAALANMLFPDAIDPREMAYNKLASGQRLGQKDFEMIGGGNSISIQVGAMMGGQADADKFAKLIGLNLDKLKRRNLTL